MGEEEGGGESRREKGGREENSSPLHICTCPDFASATLLF